jgi:hypothetical protein
MKSQRINLLQLFITILIFNVYNICLAQNYGDSVGNAKVAILNGDTAQLIITQGLIDSAFRKALDTIYPNDIAEVRITGAYIIYQGHGPTDISNVVLFCEYRRNNQECWDSYQIGVEIAYSEHLNGFGPIIEGGETHTCAGTNCSRCKLLKSGSGKQADYTCVCMQIADNCSDIPATCTHTVSKTDSGPTWGDVVAWVLGLLGLLK